MFNFLIIKIQFIEFVVFKKIFILFKMFFYKIKN